MQTIHKIIKCPKCKGAGFLVESQGIGPFREYIETTCGYCKGSGLIERTIEINDKTYFPHERRSKN